MSGPSLQYWNERLGKTPQVLRFRWNITGAVTFAEQDPGGAALLSAAAISQATIDDWLGTSSEFSADAFDATAMGADVVGGVVSLSGQCRKLLNMVAKCYSGTAGATLVERSVGSSSALTDSTLVTECAVGSSGNLGFKVDWGNTPDFDALTAGQIHIDLECIMK